MDRNRRIRIDLWQLPSWLRYCLAIAVVATVTGAGWWVGRDQSTPDWIEAYLIPILGWTYIVLACIALGSWLSSKRKH